MVYVERACAPGTRANRVSIGALFTFFREAVAKSTGPPGAKVRAHALSHAHRTPSHQGHHSQRTASRHDSRGHGRAAAPAASVEWPLSAGAAGRVLDRNAREVCGDAQLELRQRLGQMARLPRELVDARVVGLELLEHRVQRRRWSKVAIVGAAREKVGGVVAGRGAAARASVRAAGIRRVLAGLYQTPD